MVVLPVAIVLTYLAYVVLNSINEYDHTILFFLLAPSVYLGFTALIFTIADDNFSIYYIKHTFGNI